MSGEFIVQSAIAALSLGSLYAIFALGIAFIFGIMRLINFAHGEFIMIGGYTLILLVHIPSPLLLAVMGGLVVSVALVVERVAFRPVRQADPATLLITSFAVSFLIQNLAIMIFSAFPKSASLFSHLAQATSVGGIAVSQLNILTLGIAATLFVSLALFLKRTRIGVQMRAAAEDFAMARVLGVQANTVVASAFAISGLIAAVAAFLFTLQTGQVSPSTGINPVLIAFVATIIGGMGSLPGAVLGSYLLGSVTVALQLLLPQSLRPFREAFVFVVVFAMLVIRPQGLIVARAMRTRV